MRAIAIAVLCVALLWGAAPAALASGPGTATERDAAPGSGVSAQDDGGEPVGSEDGAGAQAPARYRSTWSEVERSVPAIEEYLERLAALETQYTDDRARLERREAGLEDRIVGLTDRRDALLQQEDLLQGRAARTQRLAEEQSRDVGQLARTLYQGQRPELAALTQLMEGEALRAYEEQRLLSAALAAAVTELRDLRERSRHLQSRIEQTQRDLRIVTADLQRTGKELQVVQRSLTSVADALQALAADRRTAQATQQQILAAQRAALEAARAAARAQAGVPTGLEVSETLPQSIPYRDAFITYGREFGVEPALLAAIAAQESGFNPFAGCLRSGGGKGIMQHEGQEQFCGVEAVGPSVQKSAAMLANYYRASQSWNAAVFAYNNGAGLLDEWLTYADDPVQLIAALTSFYNAQPYALAGPYAGSGSWGAWRARVAYSYAAAEPLPGFHSVVQRWLQYRAG